jgi:hypothetical protein
MTAKRSLYSVFVLLLVLLLPSVAGAAMRVEVDGKVFGTVMIENGRSFLELRNFSETVGAGIEWDNNTKTAYIAKGDTVVAFVQGKREYLVNGDVRVMDAVPLNLSGRIFVPVRFAAESLGYRVVFEHESKTVRLSSKESALSTDLSWGVQFGSSMEFTLKVKNPGTVPVGVVLSDGQDFDLVVKQAGKEIYRWSDGKMFTMALRYVTYAPGEEKKFTWEWSPPAAGTYEMEVYYLGINRREPVVQWTLVVDWEPSA